MYPERGCVYSRLQHAVAKDKLFKAVNSGAIRFLLGSTPKMGAGTNVQKRLVGLHHIDAPWRPSDLEQRGSIIRRGNTLYEDPSGFEIRDLTAMRPSRLMTLAAGRSLNTSLVVSSSCATTMVRLMRSMTLKAKRQTLQI